MKGETFMNIDFLISANDRLPERQSQGLHSQEHEGCRDGNGQSAWSSRQDTLAHRILNVGSWLTVALTPKEMDSPLRIS